MNWKIEVKFKILYNFNQVFVCKSYRKYILNNSESFKFTRLYFLNVKLASTRWADWISKFGNFYTVNLGHLCALVGCKAEESTLWNFSFMVERFCIKLIIDVVRGPSWVQIGSHIVLCSLLSIKPIMRSFRSWEVWENACSESKVMTRCRHEPWQAIAVWIFFLVLWPNRKEFSLCIHLEIEFNFDWKLKLAVTPDILLSYCKSAIFEIHAKVSRGKETSWTFSQRTCGRADSSCVN